MITMTFINLLIRCFILFYSFDLFTLRYNCCDSFCGELCADLCTSILRLNPFFNVHVLYAFLVCIDIILYFIFDPFLLQCVCT